MTDYFGEVTNYTYDAFGRLYEVQDQNKNRLQFYLYNAMGQVTQSSNNQGAAYSQYTYDELGRLTQKINQNWNINLDTYNYTYDKVGNILSKTDGTGTTTYVYDNLYRLSSVTEPDTTKTTYQYDPSGNISYKGISHPEGYEYTYIVDGEEQTAGNLYIHRETYAYNNRNQLTSLTAGVYSGEKGTIDDTTAYTYDARGNLLSASRSGSSDSQVESYSYNLLGNMTSYTKDGTTTSYTYDSSGLRTSKTNGGTTTKYYLSGGMVLNEGTVTADGVTLSATNYIGNEIFGRKNASDTVTSFLLSNGHGDIEAVMQGSTRVGTYQYDAYGNITAMNEADGFTNPIRYAGEYLDEESGNYYLRARYYNPSLGRFMAEDPAMDGQNWYAYCAGNPVMFVDPSGCYDRKNAVAYATNPNYSSPDRNDNWLLKRFRNHNPQYERFDNAADKINSALYNGTLRLGSDCTNFVSQVLVAGGIPMTEEWHYYLTIEKGIWLSGTGNYYATTIKYNRDMTSTWCNASDLYNYIVDSDNGYINGDVIRINDINTMKGVKESNGVQAGDLLFFYNATEGVHHAAVITGFAKDGTLLYSAHSNDRINEPITNEVLKTDSLIIVKLRDDA